MNSRRPSFTSQFLPASVFAFGFSALSFLVFQSRAESAEPIVPSAPVVPATRAAQSIPPMVEEHGTAALNASQERSSPGLFDPPNVVSEVDLMRYGGRWYEVESTHPRFQRGCLCTTADYTLQGPTTVGIVNTCSTNEGVRRTEGKAQVVSEIDTAKLKVTFPGMPDLSFLLGKTNYWIVDLAPDYTWAVVSTRFRTPMWIPGLLHTPLQTKDSLGT